LVGIAPQTGYEIGKVFRETPMEVYSWSPGAIYPAIRRLEALRLVERASHPKRALSLTKAGRAVLVAWLEAPIETDDAMRRIDQLLLRFAYMEHFLPTSRVRVQWCARKLRRRPEEVLRPQQSKDDADRASRAAERDRRRERASQMGAPRARRVADGKEVKGGQMTTMVRGVNIPMRALLLVLAIAAGELVRQQVISPGTPASEAAREAGSILMYAMLHAAVFAWFAARSGWPALQLFGAMFLAMFGLQGVLPYAEVLYFGPTLPFQPADVSSMPVAAVVRPHSRRQRPLCFLPG